MSGLNPAGIFEHQQRDVALTTVATPPTFDQSLQALLEALGITPTTTVADLIPSQVTLDQFLAPSGLATADQVSQVLAALNPDGVSLDTATGGLLSETVGTRHPARQSHHR